MGNFAVKTEGLTKVYKDFWRRKSTAALTNLNLTIERGKIFGLLGPNGSGKTTTAKLLLGLLFPASGKSWLLGYPSNDLKIKNKIGFYLRNPIYINSSMQKKFWISMQSSLTFRKKKEKPY